MARNVAQKRRRSAYDEIITYEGNSRGRIGKGSSPKNVN